MTVRLCLVNASLRGHKASSLKLLRRLEGLIDPAQVEVRHLTVRAKLPIGYPEETLAALQSADAVVLAFPLFCYCLSGAAIHLLEQWARYAATHARAKPVRVYAMVNSGYVDPSVNEEAIRVVRHFCARLGLEWRCALAVACGPLALMTAAIDVRLRRALASIARDICAASQAAPRDIYLWPLIPRLLPDTIRRSLDRKALRAAAARERSTHAGGIH